MYVQIQLVILAIFSIILISNIGYSFANHQDDILTQTAKEEIRNASPIMNNGFVSTSTDDYLISNNFDVRHIRAGEIMRIAGLTVEGFPYYVIHYYNFGEIEVKGKILIDNRALSLITKIVEPIEESIEEEIIAETIVGETPIKSVVLLSHTTYWKDDMKINIKVFEQDQNPQNDYWFNEYLVPYIPIIINIDHESGKHLTTIQGVTDEKGYFQGTYYVRENVEQGGKYDVHMEIGTPTNQHIKNLNTFIIAQVSSQPSGNKAPIANAGIDQNVVHPVNVILDGSASFDPEGSPITHSWIQIAGNPIVINNPTTVNPDFNTVGADVIVIQLTVSDGSKSSIDTVQITVT